jgi:mannose-6-phosphate isomerase-like protein (cupin superfamily)
VGAPAHFDVACGDIDAAVAHYEGLGFRLDMIMPADAPRIAEMSGHGVALRLELETASAKRAPVAASEFLMAHGNDAWSTGRAGMQYRDLIPGRLDGRVIASQIRIPDGGPVADYVHHHRVRFQMIYCRRGWVRVVYEDQGPAFVMREGDCVLQPPGIRHRVLESSSGLEVIEVSAPAEHETYRDHTLELPTANEQPERVFAGQRFLRHVAAEAAWQRDASGRFDIRDTGIARASEGAAGVRILRAVPTAAVQTAASGHDGEFLFLTVLSGHLRVRGPTFGTHDLGPDDACVIPAGAEYGLGAVAPCEVLEVAMPARAR